MHNKATTSIDIDQRNRLIKKSRSASTMTMGSKKKIHQNSPIKIEPDHDQHFDPENSSSIPIKTNGNNSPNHCYRRRPKRSSINGNSLLSTVASVHELMSFVIYKDHPPNWLKQTDLYQEYTNKSHQINTEHPSSESMPYCYQQLQKKQRCNLQMYVSSDQSRSIVSSPTRTPKHRLTDSPEICNKLRKEIVRSPVTDLLTPLNVFVEHESDEENSTSLATKPKTTRRRHILCKKKLPENSSSTRRARRQRMNSVENQEPGEKKDSSTSSQYDSNTSNSLNSSIEHTSPSPTTTVSRSSSSRRSSPLEYMRRHRFSSPLRIQTSISPHSQSFSTPQRRSTRIWAPSNFYIDPMWILPTVVSSKRLLVQNSAPSVSSPRQLTETNKRTRRRCRS